MGLLFDQSVVLFPPYGVWASRVLIQMFICDVLGTRLLINSIHLTLFSLFPEVRYHLDEDPKTLKVFPIPLRDSSGATLHYDRLSISPDGKILAATHGSTLQWLCANTGKVLDTAEKAHDSMSNHELF